MKTRRMVEKEYEIFLPVFWKSEYLIMLFVLWFNPVREESPNRMLRGLHIYQQK